MRATPFLSYPVDPDGPWHDLAGRVRSLDVMPSGRTPGGKHLLHLMGAGVSEEDVPILEALLAQRLDGIATVHYDRVLQRWQAEAVMDEAHVHSTCLGVPLAMGAFEVPWIHVDEREASVRLLPQADPDLFILHGKLERALGRRVSISYLDFSDYERWLQRLRPAA